VEGLSIRETAERLGIGIDTVEQQTVHGMRALVDFMLGGTGKIRRGAALRREKTETPS
jgi:RNA polymerase sigma-70 factor (ECF subfamily)